MTQPPFDSTYDVRRGRPALPVQHGTVRCYRQGCKLPQCKSAYAEYHRKSRAEAPQRKKTATAAASKAWYAKRQADYHAHMVAKHGATWADADDDARPSEWREFTTTYGKYEPPAAAGGRPPAKEPPPHGTDARYRSKRHACDCDQCTEAHRIAKKQWRRNERAERERIAHKYDHQGEYAKAEVVRTRRVS